MPWKGRYAYRLPLPDLVNAGHQLLARNHGKELGAQLLIRESSSRVPIC
jgi:hypothetical protein